VNYYFWLGSVADELPDIEDDGWITLHPDVRRKA
jgi:hypothetical protein